MMVEMGMKRMYFPPPSLPDTKTENGHSFLLYPCIWDRPYFRSGSISCPLWHFTLPLSSCLRYNMSDGRRNHQQGSCCKAPLCRHRLEMGGGGRVREKAFKRWLEVGGGHFASGTKMGVKGKKHGTHSSVSTKTSLCQRIPHIPILMVLSIHSVLDTTHQTSLFHPNPSLIVPLLTTFFGNQLQINGAASATLQIVHIVAILFNVIYCN